VRCCGRRFDDEAPIQPPGYADAETISGAADRIEADFGKLDVLVNPGFTATDLNAHRGQQTVAEGAAEIDAAAAERDRAKAEEEMRSAGVDTLDEIRTRLELAQARIAVARRPA